MSTVLTPAEVAERLGKSADYWLRKASRKEVPHVRLGRSVRFTEEDVAEIVARAHVRPADPLTSQTPGSRSRSSRRVA